MVAIESGIPMPDNFRSRAEKYPFAEMAIGDSIAISSTVKKPLLIAGNARRKHKPKIFQAGKTDKGWRIWRTA